MSKKEIKQYMSLIENILTEARYHDVWNEFKQALERNIKKDGLDTIEVEQWVNNFEIKLKEVFNNGFQNSWKIFVTHVAIGSISGHLLKVLKGSPSTIGYLNRKNNNLDTSKFIDMIEELNHFSGIQYHKIQDYNPLSKNHTIEEAIETLREYEEEYKENAEESLVKETGDEKLLVQVGEYGWYDIGKAYCENEGGAMGHCGNVDGRTRTTDKILSLRKKFEIDGETFYKPFLTFILEDDGLLGEMKGRANEKPNPKYHRAILKLLELPIIKGIKGGGYERENNFSLNDLSGSDKNHLIKHRGADWFLINSVVDKYTNDFTAFENIDLSEEMQVELIKRNPTTIYGFSKVYQDSIVEAAKYLNWEDVYGVLKDNGLKVTDKVLKAMILPSQKHSFDLYDEGKDCLTLEELLHNKLPVHNKEELYKILAKYDRDFLSNNIEYTEEMIEIAIRNNPSGIRYVDNPSEEIQEFVVSQQPRFIAYINNPSDRIVLQALKNNPYVVFHLKRLKADYIKQALTYDKHNKLEETLEDLKISDEQLIELIEWKPSLFRNIKYPSENVCIAAMRLDYYLVIDALIKGGRTEKLWLEAVRNSDDIINLVNDAPESAIKLHRELYS